MGKAQHTALAIVLACSTALAGSALAASSQEQCDVIGDAAAEIMRNRQNGVLMEEQMQMATQVQNAEAQRFMRNLVIRAYEQQQYASIADRQRAIEHFRGQMNRLCVMALAQ